MTKKNLHLSEQTIELSKRISNQQTGGDSYCHLIGLFKGYPESMREILVIHEGDYVLRNVKIYIIDQYKRNNLYDENRQKIDEFSKIKGSKFYTRTERHAASDSLANLIVSIGKVTSKTYNLGDLAPNRTTVLDNILVEKSQNEIYWIIRIMAENGSFSQRIKYINIWGNMSQASETKDSKGKLLKEMTNDDFPRNEDGTIKWNDD